MNAPQTLVVYVRQDHINQGVRCDPRQCPIARAIREKYGDNPVVSSFIGVEFDDGWATYKHSPGSQAFITRFDNGEPVTPKQIRLTLTGVRA